MLMVDMAENGLFDVHAAGAQRSLCTVAHPLLILLERPWADDHPPARARGMGMGPRPTSLILLYRYYRYSAGTRCTLFIRLWKDSDS